ncbi:MAG: hypothetical protein LBS40_08095 [Burkholderiales bacterium]|nr:hypothetical protein [Burkholderiales bacterium]
MHNYIVKRRLLVLKKKQNDDEMTDKIAYHLELARVSWIVIAITLFGVFLPVTRSRSRVGDVYLSQQSFCKRFYKVSLLCNASTIKS